MTDAEKVEIRTHWEGCWKDLAHHGCAVKEVERLRAEKDAVKISAWDKSAEQLREMARLRLERDALRADAERLNGAEAVYGLLGWLTCRDKAVTFGAAHDASIAAKLADQFCRANGLGEMGPSWPANLTHPVDPVDAARGES